MLYLIRLIKTFISLYGEFNVILWSSFLTYLTMLNAVPFVYFLIFISSHIPFVKSKIPIIKKTIIDIVPAYSHELLHYFDLFLNNISQLELINTVIFSFSIISLIGAFFGFAHNIYPSKKKNIIKIIFSLFAMLILTSFVISVMIAAKIVIPLFLPNIANMVYVKLFPLFVWFAVILSVFYLLKDKKIPFIYTLIASFITTLFVFILKIFLGMYFSMFTYSKIYGAVAIIPTILLWLFLLWNILLLGVMLPRVIKDTNNSLEKEK